MSPNRLLQDWLLCSGWICLISSLPPLEWYRADMQYGGQSFASVCSKPGLHCINSLTTILQQFDHHDQSAWPLFFTKTLYWYPSLLWTAWELCSNSLWLCSNGWTPCFRISHHIDHYHVTIACPLWYRILTSGPVSQQPDRYVTTARALCSSLLRQLVTTIDATALTAVPQIHTKSTTVQQHGPPYIATGVLPPLDRCAATGWPLRTAITTRIIWPHGWLRRGL